MTRSVLFVDDEPRVLAGLKRSLRRLRKEWQMEFVESGELALATLAARPFDVIVSDMRMPGMDGVELLTEVKERHPSMVRLVLSGYSEREDTMRATGVAHQYLSKPCDAEALQSVVARAMSLRATLDNEAVAAAVASMHALPSMPALYSEVRAELNSDDPSLARVAAVVSRDPGMASKVLQLVNSAFFGLRRSVSNPEQAVTLLGIDTILSLALGLELFKELDAAKAAGLGVDALWQRGMAVAGAAKKIAVVEKQSSDRAAEAYLAGLLHDCGRLVLAANFPDEFRWVQQRAEELGSLNAAEEEAFGVTHAEVGAYLLSMWGLPDTLIEAVALHHHPNDASVREFSPLTAVHAAGAFEEGPPPSQGGIELDADYLGSFEGQFAAWRDAAKHVGNRDRSE